MDTIELKILKIIPPTNSEINTMDQSFKEESSWIINRKK